VRIAADIRRLGEGLVERTTHCNPRPAFQETSFPRDHLRDIFGSFEKAEPAQLQFARPIGAGVVLLVTRERGEHANLFHACTDWLNAFIALHVAGVINGDTSDHHAVHKGMENVQVPHPSHA
jgi:hypothetical protein